MLVGSKKGVAVVDNEACDSWSSLNLLPVSAHRCRCQYSRLYGYGRAFGMDDGRSYESFVGICHLSHNRIMLRYVLYKERTSDSIFTLAYLHGGVVMLLLVFCRLTPIVVFVLIGVMGMLCASIFRLMYSIALHGEKCENNLVSGVMITVIACGGL